MVQETGIKKPKQYSYGVQNQNNKLKGYYNTTFLNGIVSPPLHYTYLLRL